MRFEGNDNLSKVESFYWAVATQTERKSAKLTIHSTLKSLSNHQKLLRLDSISHIFTQGHLYQVHVGSPPCIGVSMRM